MIMITEKTEIDLCEFDAVCQACCTFVIFCGLFMSDRYPQYNPIASGSQPGVSFNTGCNFTCSDKSSSDSSSSSSSSCCGDGGGGGGGGGDGGLSGDCCGGGSGDCCSGGGGGGGGCDCGGGGCDCGGC